LDGMTDLVLIGG